MTGFIQVTVVPPWPQAQFFSWPWRCAHGPGFTGRRSTGPCGRFRSGTGTWSRSGREPMEPCGRSGWQRPPLQPGWLLTVLRSRQSFSCAAISSVLKTRARDYSREITDEREVLINLCFNKVVVPKVGGGPPYQAWNYCRGGPRQIVINFNVNIEADGTV